MKFGKVDQPEQVDFTMPPDHLATAVVLKKSTTKGAMDFYCGLPTWNRSKLKNFYPRGTKDELTYYATQFNAIELNATFYRIFPPEQFARWYDKTPSGFKFFPKLSRDITHLRRLNESSLSYIDTYLESAIQLNEKLGTIFLQMHNNFSPKNWDRVVRFIEFWPKEFSLAIEFRHIDWFTDSKASQELYHLLEENSIANVLVDTAGRRDLMHMRLTNNEAFIRFVGANHPSDYPRLNAWVKRIKKWQEEGLKNVHFFVHQNLELETPLLSDYLIDGLHREMGDIIKVPKKFGGNKPLTLF